MKKIISILMTTVLLVLLFAGCGTKEKEEAGVYYLNFKPEQDSAWQKLANEYTRQTGVKVNVVTASQGTYEQTLLAEIDKEEAPTLFQINGPVGLEAWKDYAMDLSGTAIYEELVSDDFALKDGDKVYGVAYVYETYGLITNEKLLNKAGYDTDEINSFSDLKRIAEDITKRKDELGFSAFTSSSLASSSSWRFSGHLANIPLYYEFADKNIVVQPSKLEGTYLKNFKNLWDLYINNSTISKNTITSEQNDAAAEFKNEKAVFYQNGTWEYDNIKSIGEDNIDFLPIYAGINDKEQGLCSGTENYWAINNEASKEEKIATLNFLKWVVTSEEGTRALAEDMGFSAPFKKAKKVNNKLADIAAEYVDDGKYSVVWVFTTTPNVDVWRNELVDALSAYTVGKQNWDKVEKAFVDGWETQYKASKQ